MICFEFNLFEHKSFTVHMQLHLQLSDGAEISITRVSLLPLVDFKHNIQYLLQQWTGFLPPACLNHS